CAWRGIDFELSSCSLGERFDAGAHDLFYLGGGQDRDQRLCAEDLIETKSAALHAAAARGAVVLGVCGGFQLLGHHYTLGNEQIEGVGLLDVATVRGQGPRLIGNLAIALSPGASAGEEGVEREAHLSALRAARICRPCRTRPLCAQIRTCALHPECARP